MKFQDFAESIVFKEPSENASVEECMSLFNSELERLKKQVAKNLAIAQSKREAFSNENRQVVEELRLWLHKFEENAPKVDSRNTLRKRFGELRHQALTDQILKEEARQKKIREEFFNNKEFQEKDKVYGEMLAKSMELYGVLKEYKDFSLFLEKLPKGENIETLFENGYNALHFLKHSAKSQIAKWILLDYECPSGGRGYCDYSMSANAFDAYENGEKPLSKWNKADAEELGEILGFKITLKELKEFLEDCGYTIDHHTSKHYNKTSFYSIAKALRNDEGGFAYFSKSKDGDWIIEN